MAPVVMDDSEGPSIRIRPESGCEAAGASVAVTSDLGTVRALLAPHTFLGAHAQEMLVGASGPTSVRVGYMAGEPFVQDLVVSDRATLTVPCRP